MSTVPAVLPNPRESAAAQYLRPKDFGHEAASRARAPWLIAPGPSLSTPRLDQVCLRQSSFGSDAAATRFATILIDPQPPKAPGDKPWCSTIDYRSSMQTMTGILDAIGATTAEFAPLLSTAGRDVIDKTGLEGRFDFHLEYAREGGPPPADPDPAHAGLSIFSAVQEQLGLKLESAKGPVAVLVIDPVERPEGN